MSTRYLNLTGEDVCPYCEPGQAGPSGLVHVSTTPKGMVEYGPCPHCEAGERVERRRWRRGYWQGRPADLARPKPFTDVNRLPNSKKGEFIDIPPGATVELSPRENYLRTLLLTARYEGEKVDPAVGIDIGSGERRRLLVEHELAKVGS